MIWATNFSESLFSFSKIILGFLIMVLTYNALIIKPRQTYLGLIISCSIVLGVYIIAGIWQYLQITESSFTKLYDISGINGHKNLLSAMLFVLSSFLLTAVPFLKKRFTKAIPITIYIISFIFVILLKSRAAILGFIISIIVFIFLLIIRKKKYIVNHKGELIISIIAVILTFLFFTVVLRKASAEIVEKNASGSHTEYNILSASSMYERLELWNNTYKLSDEHPLGGCGLGNWKVDIQSIGTINLYRCDVWNINFVRPHNEFLGLLSECGYIIFGVYLMFLCSFIVFSFFAVCGLKNIRDFMVGAIALCIFAGANTISLFDFPNERIEFIVWINIIIGILYVILAKNKSYSLHRIFNCIFLLLSIFIGIIGYFRYMGEYYTYDMQQAIKNNDLNATVKYSQKSISPFFNIDPVGYPIDWYKGHALMIKGDARAKYSLKEAYKNAPYCKQNLNDLGFVTYYEEHDLDKAEYYLRESLRISPNYVYSGFNLVGIFMREQEYNKARMVLDIMIMDEEKQAMLLRDVEFFATDNLEYETRRLIYEYETRMKLQHVVDSLRLQLVE